jgi:voltage-gated potassium channel Kch
MWWCIVTLTTTGYGDMFPLTFGGRVIAGTTMLFGLVLFGILLNIVGKTIMVLLFGESLTDESSAPATREAILTPCFIDGDSDRIGEIKAAIIWPHR